MIKTHQTTHSRIRLVLRQETVRMLTSEQLALAVAGSLTSGPACSFLTGCPNCKPP